MCGIVGIVRFNPLDCVDESRLKRMRDTLRHRGPDGEGLYLDGPVGLGHRRLSIVDVAGGHQPMANEDESVWITYNGEIYNHASLRPGLQARGHLYRTLSDTETILHLYEEEGERCVERLQGMFAFGLWDRSRRRLLLARDRLGIKPLYYACTDQELLFASEIKAILAGLPRRPEFNEAILSEFLANRFVPGEETFFKGVRKLLPGRTLSWSAAEGLGRRRYWRLPTEIDVSDVSLEEHALEVRRRLQEVVQSHLMSDVPLGLFLSGGIDSSGIAALMAPMVEDRVRTFSVGFDDPAANELEYARLVARSIGALHREVVVSPDEYFSALPQLIWHEDEPIAFPSSVPLYFVSKLAGNHVKVVLTGEGSDELFLGYNWYRVTAWNARLGALYWRTLSEPVAGAIGRFVEQRAPHQLSRYAGRTFLTRRPDIRSLFCENFSVFSTGLQSALVVPELLNGRDPYAERLRCFNEAPGGVLEKMSHLDLQTYLVELLMKQDQMSMAASIESRVPFLDHAFVEHAVGIPSRFKVRGWKTKAVLREALSGLVPREILTRRKMGFPVPVGRWLRGPFWSLVQEFVLGERALSRRLFEPSALRGLAEAHRGGGGAHGDRLWLLLNLEIWQRIFLDGEDPAAIMRAR